MCPPLPRIRPSRCPVTCDCVLCCVRAAGPQKQGRLTWVYSADFLTVTGVAAVLGPVPDIFAGVHVLCVSVHDVCVRLFCSCCGWLTTEAALFLLVTRSWLHSWRGRVCEPPVLCCGALLWCYQDRAVAWCRPQFGRQALDLPVASLFFKFRSVWPWRCRATVCGRTLRNRCPLVVAGAR